MEKKFIIHQREHLQWEGVPLLSSNVERSVFLHLLPTVLWKDEKYYSPCMEKDQRRHFYTSLHLVELLILQQLHCHPGLAWIAVMPISDLKGVLSVRRHEVI